MECLLRRDQRNHPEIHSLEGHQSLRVDKKGFASLRVSSGVNRPNNLCCSIYFTKLILGVGTRPQGKEG